MWVFVSKPREAIECALRRKMIEERVRMPAQVRIIGVMSKSSHELLSDHVDHLWLAVYVYMESYLF
jgi:hypothetical protein